MRHDADDITTVQSLQYDFATIESATNSFSPDNMVGEGGFGKVYKGILPTGQEVAVKRLSSSSGQGAEEFMNEVFVVAKLQHRNLARLFGFCLEGEEKILVYEFVPYKSLDYFLFYPEKPRELDWPTRYKIITGIAKGILYLHEDSRLKIVHRDLKPSNILLDRDMNSKISDFGMAKIFEGYQSHATTKRIVGTYGYMAPEYAMYGEFSTKSDVYSFGVLVLEIITGQRSSSFYEDDDILEDLLSFVWRNWAEGMALKVLDPCLPEPYSRVKVVRCINIGLLCVQQDPEDRPTMEEIVSMLNGYSVTRLLPQELTICFYNGKGWTTTTFASSTFSCDTSTSVLFHQAGNDISTTEALQQFDFGTILTATHGFSATNKVGEGGHGDVYKGVLANGQEIVVKRLRNAWRAQDVFKKEFMIGSKLQHKSFVRLLGFFYSREEKLLVYEFMPKNNLSSILFDNGKKGQLDWLKRYNIIKGTARGILYIHEDSRLRIIHHHIATPNILLDEEMNPKISGFDMARLFGDDQTEGSGNDQILCTIDYVAPELLRNEQSSTKADVYSFGILVLEIVSGKVNSSLYQKQRLDLAAYVWKHWLDGNLIEVMEPTIRESCIRDEVIRCIHIGLLCIEEDPENRPPMATVVSMLNGYVFPLPCPQRPAMFACKPGRNVQIQIQRPAFLL